VKAFGANLFIDNQSSHCQDVSSVAPTAQVLNEAGGGTASK